MFIKAGGCGTIIALPGYVNVAAHRQDCESVTGRTVGLDPPLRGWVLWDEVQAALGTPEMPDNALYFTLEESDLFASILHRYHQGAPLTADQQHGTAQFGQEAQQ